MKCEVCGNEIKRGQRYKSETHKSKYFCSIECYNQFVVIRNKENEPRNRLKACINNLFNQPNWPMFMRQISNLEQENNLTDNDLRLVIKYAIEYESYSVDEHYGLGQFEKFIEPAMQFKKDIKNSLSLSEDVDSSFIITQTINKTEKRKFRNHLDFD